MLSGYLTFVMLLMHPVHETVSEVEWNPNTGRLEVAMRLSVLDEQWIGRKHKHAKTSQWAIKYLQARFQIDPPARDAENQQPNTKYHWIGRRLDGSHVWWFFEMEPTNGKPPTTIESRMLLDNEPNFVNRVVVLGTKKRQAVSLTREHPAAKVNLAPMKPSH